MDILALIPARAGSKRVPGKNTRLLCGKPLIQYSIDHARSIEQINRVGVTTDDQVVASIAMDSGCDVIKRPDTLATDNSLTIDVVKHALEFYADRGEFPNYVLLLQPTVPIRESRTLVEAITKIKSEDCDSVTSHIQVDLGHPNRLKVITNGRLFSYENKELENIPRSQLPKVYFRDGSIYLFKSSLPFEYNSLIGDHQIPVISRNEYYVNIDEFKDWLLAEALLNYYRKSLILDTNRED